MKTYTIYCVENTKNGKKYIGQTCAELTERKAMHKYQSLKLNNKHGRFNEAIRKYGWDSFKWSILQKDLNMHEANNREEFWITLFQTTKREYGYNTSPGGHKCADSTKRKISESEKGKKVSVETRRKQSEAHKGKKYPPRTEEYRRKLSEANKGKTLSVEHRRKLSESHKGIKHSEERKRNMSEAQKSAHDKYTGYCKCPHHQKYR